MNGLIIIRYICVFFVKNLNTTDFLNIFQIVSNNGKINYKKFFKVFFLDENFSDTEINNEDDNCDNISAAENFLLNLVNILCNILIKYLIIFLIVF